MEPTPCPTYKSLNAFALGKLPPEELEQVAQHTSVCPPCQAQLQTLDSVADDLLKQLRSAPANKEPASEAALSDLLPRLEALAASHSQAGTNAGEFADEEQESKQILAPAQGPDELGRLGSYRVLKLVGAGGMGIVFKAEDPQLHRMVALKVMKPSFASHPTARQRFVREAQATAQVRNEHVVTIYQVTEDRGVPIIAMEFLEGETLDSFVRRTAKQGRLPVAEILRIGQEIAEGLAAAHERGLIHRDIKPSNIWLEKSGRVKIVDFGLARTVDEDIRLTQTGTVLGTPAYMSPEQANGSKTDARSDLFSVGGVLYQLCAGEVPFQGTGTFEVLLAVVNEQPRPITELNPHVPKPLVDLIGRLLAKKPDDRPASARDVAHALKALSAPPLVGSASPPSGLSSTQGISVTDATFVSSGVVPAKRGPRLWPKLGVGGAVLGVAALGIYFMVIHDRHVGSLPPSNSQADGPPASRPQSDRPADQEFIDRIAKLPTAAAQIGAINLRMKQLNPGFPGIGPRQDPWGYLVTEAKDGEKSNVRVVKFRSDTVIDLSPLAALTELREITCPGSEPGKGKVADLTPLKALKLLRLDISCTDVKDLSHLQGMAQTMTKLNCAQTRVRDLGPLKDFKALTYLECDTPLTRSDLELLSLLPSLTQINNQPKRAFLKTAKPVPEKP